MPAMTSSAAEEHAVTIMLHARMSRAALTRTRSVVIAVSTLVLAELPTAG